MIPCLLAALALPAAAPPNDAGLRVAVVVGNNLGLEDELQLAYAESDAERVARALRDVGAFDPAHIHVLVNRPADDLRRLLDTLEGDGSPSDRPMVLFYYSGHGDAAALHLSGTRLGLAELRGRLARLSTRLSVAVVDACKSGALTRAKGASRGPSFSLDVQQLPDIAGSVVIASSAEDEMSQESAALEGSYFTHHWVMGLYGRADANGDGLVMLDEAYRYAHFRTVETTIQSRGGVQHPSYRFDLSGQGNVVLASLHRSTAQISLAADGPGGRYFILDPDRSLIIGELVRGDEGSTRVRLPPGSYRIRKREPRRALVIDVALAAGDHVTIADEQMHEVPLELHAQKGATVDATVEAPGGLVRHGPWAGGGVRSGIISTMGPTAEIRAGYDLSWADWSLQPRVVLRTAIVERSAATDPRFEHRELDLGLEAAARWEIGAWRLRLGADVGLVLFDQTQLEGGRPPSPGELTGAVPVGFQGTAAGTVAYALGSFEVELRAHAGVAVFNRDGEVAAGFAGGGGLGVAYLF